MIIQAAIAATGNTSIIAGPPSAGTMTSTTTNIMKATTASKLFIFFRCYQRRSSNPVSSESRELHVVRQVPTRFPLDQEFVLGPQLLDRLRGHTANQPFSGFDLASD